jgi:hypothetical protein
MAPRTRSDSHPTLSFDGPTCEACGHWAPTLKVLPNGTMEPWHVCEECLAQDAGERSQIVNLQRYRAGR